MRTFSIIAAVFTALVLLFVGYSALTGDMDVTVTSITAEPASNQYEAFTTAGAWFRKPDSTSITRFTDTALGDISNYSMAYVTVALSNWNPWPAEWIQVHVMPAEGDVMQIRQEPVTARPLGKTIVQSAIITSSSNPAEARKVMVEYYIFGRRHVVTSQPDAQ